MTVRAVVFDMDGVLIDAREWHYEALNRALGHFGLCISRFDHLVTFDGLPTRAKLEMLSVERGLPRRLHPFINDLKQRYTMEMIATSCKPVFQHEYTLGRLKAEGYLIAVASNSVRSTIEAMMSQAALLPYLDAILSNEDVSRGKPDPEIYVRAFERLGVSAADALVVEDNEKGVRAARGAGAHVLEVQDPSDVTYERVAGELALMNTGVPQGRAA